MDEFHLRLTGLKIEIASILGVPLAELECTTLGVNLDQCLEEHIGCAEKNRNAAYLLLLYLLRDLQRLAKVRPELLHHFSDLLLQRDVGNFFGVRFEIRIAAALIRRRLAFVADPGKTSRPDFYVQAGGKQVSIECKSCASISRSPLTLMSAKKKIIDAIEEKAGKAYFNSSTWLFIDVTNLLSNRADFTVSDLIQSQDDLYVEVCARDGGGLGLFWTYWKNDAGTLGVGSNCSLWPCSYAPAHVKSLAKLYLGDAERPTGGGWIPTRT